MRTALHTREYGAVDERRDILEGFLGRLERTADLTLAEDHTAAGTTERLVRRGSDDMEAVIERILGDAARNKAGDVRHIGHEQRTDLVADFSELGVIKLSRISAETRQDDFRFVLESASSRS